MSKRIFYISVDIEGIAGVVAPWQCQRQPDELAYRQAVDTMAREAVFVALAALKNDFTEVWINDAHAHMTNLGLGHLEHWCDALGQPQALKQLVLLSGKPKSCAMLAHLDSPPSGKHPSPTVKGVSAIAFVGYHAKASTQNAVLCHSFHPLIIDIAVNGMSLGEGGLNALHAVYSHHIPVVFASGDDAFVNEFSTLLPHVPTVATKHSLGFATARCLSWDAVAALYTASLKKVFTGVSVWQQWQGPLALLLGDTKESRGASGKRGLEKSSKTAWDVVVTVANPLCADAIGNIPGWRRLNGVTLSASFDTVRLLYQGLQTAYGLLPGLAPWQPY